MNVAIWEKRGDLKASIGRNGWLTALARTASASRPAPGSGRPRPAHAVPPRSSAKAVSSSAIGTRIWPIESRSRIVTRPSPASPFSVSPTVCTSTVTQYGVPTSSWRR